MVTLLRKGAKSRRFGAISLMAATALVLAACGGGDSEPQAQGSDSDALISEADCQRNRDAGKIIYISGYGYSASAGQMDVFLAEEMGFFDDLCLDVEINAAGGDGQQLVSSGQAHFTALGSASDVLLAAANSKNLTAVATYGTTSPFSIFANEDIKSLKDLEGKKLGFFINLTPIAQAMLDSAGVDSDKVEFIKMTNYDPTVVTRGQVDAIVGYASNQPENLRAMDLPFSEFLPDEFDVQGTYNVMEANTEFLNANREVAADFMRADLKALEYCLENDDECVEMISDLAADNQQGDAFAPEQQARTWGVESEWVRTSIDKRPGVHTADMWQAEYDIVNEYSDSTLPPLADVMDEDLIADLYDGDTLIWPGK